MTCELLNALATLLELAYEDDIRVEALLDITALLRMVQVIPLPVRALFERDLDRLCRNRPLADLPDRLLASCRGAADPHSATSSLPSEPFTMWPLPDSFTSCAEA